jgi:tRNA nucleotidyltransferase (CCA-adding enzyme)
MQFFSKKKFDTKITFTSNPFLKFFPQKNMQSKLSTTKKNQQNLTFSRFQFYTYQQLSDNYWPQFNQATLDELDRFGELDDRLQKRLVTVGRTDFR